MTNAHHVDFWEDGGQTNLHKMIPLCYHHHRLVHEGGYQVVLAGERVEFIPPDRPVMTRRRWVFPIHGEVAPSGADGAGPMSLPHSWGRADGAAAHFRLRVTAT